MQMAITEQTVDGFDVVFDEGRTRSMTSQMG